MSNAIDIARRLDALGQTEEACSAYTLALHQSIGVEPEEELESAIYLFQHGEDYKIPYTTFRDLYNRGYFRNDLLNIMTGAFYTPNVKLMQRRYEKNCKLLSKYPYLFHKDFPSFEKLPIRFFPYDDNGYLPFQIQEERFFDYWNPNHPVISRNFFKDLENPILAADVFSQYELEYLNDNVRPSEWVGRENHIYLHYTNWMTFCSYLQVLNLRIILEDKKIVFLVENEIGQYPIDFKARFGVDYTQFTPKPVGVREVQRLIWHTQLSSHNGGDFFNEIFYGHPNLLCIESLMMSDVDEILSNTREVILKKTTNYFKTFSAVGPQDKNFVLDAALSLRKMSHVTDKDILVASFLDFAASAGIRPDPAQRIAPAVFFQPHFHTLKYVLEVKDQEIQLHSKDYEKVMQSPVFRAFRYVKTFTPMRRMTTSAAAAVKFQVGQIDTDTGYAKPDEEYAYQEDERIRHTKLLTDEVVDRLLNRSFMIDWQERLFQDCVLVRFEDGKLNPKATFTALAAFLDLPYTESMTYCSSSEGINPESLAGNVRGFDPATVYRTYDEYMGRAERVFLEYLMQDVYEAYGYDCHYYDGTPLTKERAEVLSKQFDTMEQYIAMAYKAILRKTLANIQNPLTKEEAEECERTGVDINISPTYFVVKQKLEERPEEGEKICQELTDAYLEERQKHRMFIYNVFQKSRRFVNKNGQPLHLMPLLKLDPELLEQPLYH